MRDWLWFRGEFRNCGRAISAAESNGLLWIFGVVESERHLERKETLLLYIYFFLHIEPLLLSGNEPRHGSHMA